MMPVESRPEPIHFTEQVRIPGQKFLADVPKPKRILATRITRHASGL